jgi:hypothetical protein
MFEGKNPPLVPGRECGGCDICCVHLTIDEPELRKPLGERCHNLLPSINRCAIYESRPQTCRGFFCGWRSLRWVKPGLRPDISGVLITLTYHDKAGEILHAKDFDKIASTGVSFILLRQDALESEGLAESVAAAVSSGTQVHICISSSPGPTPAVVRVDGALKSAVLARDKAGVLNWLRKAWDMGSTAKSEETELSAPCAPTGRDEV